MSNNRPERGDSRLRFLYLYRMLKEDTDENHTLSTPQIMRRMAEEYGISMHRTSLYSDIDLLQKLGVEVVSVRKQAMHYYLSGRPFSVPELRLLIDAVLSSKFITDSKSKTMVEKLTRLTSKPNAEKLYRTVHVTGKAKSENEKGYAIVDAINEAIHDRCRISFPYFDYDNRKRHNIRNDGQPYTVSPYDLIYDGDFYYMTGYCDERGEVRTFRVDRIERVPEILRSEAVKKPSSYRLERYTQEVFRMFSTDDTIEVTLLCDADMMKAMIDKFGERVRTKPIGDDKFHATVKVCASPTFYRWIFGWGGKIKIEGPKAVKDCYKKMLFDELQTYSDGGL